MSYEPTNWKTGDVVTSAKLNKLENGVKNAVTVHRLTLDTSGAGAPKPTGIELTPNQLMAELEQGAVLFCMEADLGGGMYGYEQYVIKSFFVYSDTSIVGIPAGLTIATCGGGAVVNFDADTLDSNFTLHESN